MFDEEDFRDYEDEIQDVVKQYEEMLEKDESVYFDTEEFGMIIDYYTQRDEIEKSRHAVDLAMIQPVCKVLLDALVGDLCPVSIK